MISPIWEQLSVETSIRCSTGGGGSTSTTHRLSICMQAACEGDNRNRVCSSHSEEDSGSDSEKHGTLPRHIVEDYSLLGLLPPDQAQSTRVVHIPSFLSASEMSSLCEWIRGVGPGGSGIELGVVQRGLDGKADPHGAWRTSYLHTDGHFRHQLPALHQKMRLAIERVDADNWGVLSGRVESSLNFRTVECHEYKVDANLNDPEHCDSGSLITMDIMLSQPGEDFDGGVFVTPNHDGTVTPHPVELGDALFLLSHKYHNVTPVIRGKRVVLVAELWEGVEKRCPHRCTARGTTCTHKDFWHCDQECGFTSNDYEECCSHEASCDGVGLEGVENYSYGCRLSM